MTNSQTWRVPVGGTEVTAVFDASETPDAPVFICAHGAGGNLADRGVVKTAEVMRSIGMHTVRFNFAYREKKISRPDPMPQLTACVTAVAEQARALLRPRLLIIGGRSAPRLSAASPGTAAATPLGSPSGHQGSGAVHQRHTR
jgi:predicted alpha/beta-hydrolase family hydrolase